MGFFLYLIMKDFDKMGKEKQEEGTGEITIMKNKIL
jgi:hypothetical protein